MLRAFIEGFIADFLSAPENNDLGPGRAGTAWDGFLLGFSSGDDELYTFWKEHISDFHWSPAEAFALGLGDVSASRGAAAASAEVAAAAGTAAGVAGATRGVAAAGAAPGVRPDELSVISFALCQTEATKAANRSQTRYASELWARTRIFGQKHNNRLQRALVAALAAQGQPAVAPSLLPHWEERMSPLHGQASVWSERHVAYTSGLGTFGHCGGLITERGKAVRFGSVIVGASIPPTPRPYSDPFAYCLYYHGDEGCVGCTDRCPAGSVTADGRDKPACAVHLIPGSRDFVSREYGFDGYGCGLCQTGVPCESEIPPSLRVRGTA